MQSTCTRDIATQAHDLVGIKYSEHTSTVKKTHEQTRNTHLDQLREVAQQGLEGLGPRALQVGPTRFDVLEVVRAGGTLAVGDELPQRGAPRVEKRRVRGAQGGRRERGVDAAETSTPAQHG